MKILNVMWSSGGPFASVHKVHRTVIEAIGAREPHTWLLSGAPHAGCESVGEVRAWGFSSRLLKGRGVWSLAQALVRRRLGRAVAALRPECVLVDGLGSARVMLPVLVASPDVPVVVLVHGHARVSPKDRELLKGNPARKVSIVAVSATLADELKAKLPEWADRITPVATALSPERFTGGLLSRSEARRCLGIEQGELAFGAIGRLVESKGFLTLIEAFARAMKSRPACSLTLVGDGDQRRLLEDRVAQLGLNGRVRFAGYRTDAACLYRAFDWIAIPSFKEGQGLVVQEAVLADVPCVLSDIAVFRMQLGEAGLYAPPGDVEAWTRLLGQCPSLEPSAAAGAQRVYLAPERAWTRFSDGYRALSGFTPG